MYATSDLDMEKYCQEKQKLLALTETRYSYTNINFKIKVSNANFLYIKIYQLQYTFKPCDSYKTFHLEP